MQVHRVIEVWECGMNGKLLTRWPVASTIAPAYLLRLFEREQKVADPHMLLSYLLSRQQIAALQPYVAQEMVAGQYDFILSVLPAPAGTSADLADDAEPFD
ncbi:hypothetical protein [Chitinimonas sp.]|uniref:hypothetical protein n=1 Tax=Chitinimonas sp. TaxID=1934313 RepID=UPI0035B26DA6